MNETTTPVYRMNPAEDEIRFGDELAEGMWVLAETPWNRQPGGETEDDQVRAQRFRQVTRLQTRPYFSTTVTRFVGEWVDGYAEVHEHNIETAWLVRKDPPGQEEETPS
jgi:hypothetical protein